MKRAAEYDSVVGMNHLAVMYESGIGTPADEGKAEYWCRRAADRGHAEAACQYGIYQREKGHAKTAMRYFRQSAEKETPVARRGSLRAIFTGSAQKKTGRKRENGWKKPPRSAMRRRSNC